VAARLGCEDADVFQLLDEVEQDVGSDYVGPDAPVPIEPGSLAALDQLGARAPRVVQNALSRRRSGTANQPPLDEIEEVDTRPLLPERVE